MKKLFAIFLSAVLPLTACSGTQKANGYKQVTSDEAVCMMNELDSYIILDVRTAAEFAEKHIPNALNIPNEEIGDGEISLLPDKQQYIFVYCRSGNRSKQASSKLARLGYVNVIEFGGINSWNGPTVSE